MGTRTLGLVVTLVLDCLPIPDVDAGRVTLPDVDELQDAAALVLGDCWDLYLGIKRAALASELFENEAGEPLFADPGCVGVDVGDLSFFGPQGRTAGASLPIRVIVE
jgi:hypothetical protein